MARLLKCIFYFFRLLFGGSLPHYFYEILERLFPEEVVAFPLAKKLIFERLLIAPLMQAFSLYTLARFEGKTHIVAIKQLKALYLPVLQANWKWLTLFQVINLAFVPPMVSFCYFHKIEIYYRIHLACVKLMPKKFVGLLEMKLNHPSFNLSQLVINFL